MLTKDVSLVSSQYQIDIIRVRDFLKIPYLYKVTDSFDSRDPNSYYDTDEYQEDIKTDSELLRIASQVAELIYSETGLWLADVRQVYEYGSNTCGIIKFYPSPLLSINDFYLDGVQTPITIKRDKDYTIDVGRSFTSARLDITCGFGINKSVRYRDGNKFLVYNFSVRDFDLDPIQSDAGVPYDSYYLDNPIPAVALRLYEVLIDHFYMHRGIILTGTIATSLPNTLNSLIESVKRLMPLNFDKELTFTP